LVPRTYFIISPKGGHNVNIIAIIVGLFFVAGVILAIVEYRRGKVFLAHDMNKQSAQNESDRETIRSTGIFQSEGNSGFH
jgi:predicted histidine transporter YuiF (NhaC family)